MPIGFTPTYQIIKDGIDISGHFNDRTTSIRVDFAGGDGSGDTATLSLDDRDWQIARPNVGDRISLYLGYVEVGLAPMGVFEFDEVTFSLIPKSITLKCSSTGQRSLLKSQQTKNYTNQSLGDIFTDLAKRGGLSAEVHPDIARKMVAALNATTSPMQAISELERHYGAVAKVSDGKLTVVPRDGGQSPSLQTAPIVVFSPEHFGHCEVRHTSRSAYTSVKAAYVDENHVTQFVEQALPGIDALTGLGSIPFVPERKFNDRATAEAAAKAQAQSLTRSLGEASIEMAKGDPWIRDQQRFLIRGTRDGMNGSYVTDLVSHTYVKESGITTALKARPDGDGEDYESLFKAATPEQAKALFLNPPLGGVIGEVLSQGLALGGLNPFSFAR